MQENHPVRPLSEAIKEVAETRALPPVGCRLKDAEWRRYLDYCKQGNLFFTRGRSLLSRINHFYQRRLLGKAHELHADHVGVIGDARGAYESLVMRGPTRDRSLDRYLVGEGPELIIARLTGNYSDEDTKRAMLALIYYIQGTRGYDWISLATRGALQMNNRAICSELVQVYINEVFKRDEQFQTKYDRLVLPDEIYKHVMVLWHG